MQNITPISLIIEKKPSPDISTQCNEMYNSDHNKIPPNLGFFIYKKLITL